jgi:hypothetical protein
VNREQIRALAKKLPRGSGGQQVLLPLAEKNDPFMAGTPAHRDMARWFKELWDKFGYQRGKHVRDIHYDIATRLSYTYYKHDDTPYLHTKASYTYMQNAARYARHLGLMGDELDDKRSEPIKKFAKPRDPLFDGSREPGFEAEFDEDEWGMPEVHIDEPAAFPFPEAGVEGYDYHPSDQPVHVEVWVEKIKAAPQLERVCRQHSVNLQWGSGTFGIEVCRDLVDRVRAWEKPARIIYLCDYDPAGIQMPVSVGRQVEFILNEANEHDLDIKLEVLAVTTGQITELELPRKPFEEQKHLWAQTRADNFEKHLGEGGTELNAISDAKLAELVEERIKTYRDEGLRERRNRSGRRSTGGAGRGNRRGAGRARRRAGGVARRGARGGRALPPPSREAQSAYRSRAGVGLQASRGVAAAHSRGDRRPGRGPAGVSRGGGHRAVRGRTLPLRRLAHLS